MVDVREMFEPFRAKGDKEMYQKSVILLNRTQKSWK